MMHRLINNIDTASSFIRQTISNWYNYRYDAGLSNNYISDGGFDMFDSGNKVNFMIKLLFRVFASLKFKKHFSVNNYYVLLLQNKDIWADDLRKTSVKNSLIRSINIGKKAHHSKQIL